MEEYEGNGAGFSIVPTRGLISGLKEVIDDPVRKNNGLLTTITTAQDWIGPNDPENPRNWSTPKKIYHVLVPSLFGFIVYAEETRLCNCLQLTRCI